MKANSLTIAGAVSVQHIFPTELLSYVDWARLVQAAGSVDGQMDSRTGQAGTLSIARTGLFAGV